MEIQIVEQNGALVASPVNGILEGVEQVVTAPLAPGVTRAGLLLWTGALFLTIVCVRYFLHRKQGGTVMEAINIVK